EAEPEVRRPARSGLRYVRQGFLANSLNPKVALFFVTFLPQFMSPGDSPLRRGLLLSGIFAMLYLAWFGCYVLTVDLIGAQLRKQRVRAAIERVTGLLLIGFAGGRAAPGAARPAPPRRPVGPGCLARPAARPSPGPPDHSGPAGPAVASRCPSVPVRSGDASQA